MHAHMHAHTHAHMRTHAYKQAHTYTHKMAKPVSIPETFASFTEAWSPRLVAAVNDAHVKVARLEGSFVWHAHADSDELFYVLEGDLDLELELGRGSGPEAGEEGKEKEKMEGEAEGGPDGAVDVVRMRAGDVYVVPRGVRHRPVAGRSGGGARVLLVERDTTVNTGDAAASRRTRAPVDARGG